jgi:hypothetical protein
VERTVGGDLISALLGEGVHDRRLGGLHYRPANGGETFGRHQALQIGRDDSVVMLGESSQLGFGEETSAISPERLLAR